MQNPLLMFCSYMLKVACPRGLCTNAGPGQKMRHCNQCDFVWVNVRVQMHLSSFASRFYPGHIDSNRKIAIAAVPQKNNNAFQIERLEVIFMLTFSLQLR